MRVTSTFQDLKFVPDWALFLVIITRRKIRTTIIKSTASKTSKYRRERRPSNTKTIFSTILTLSGKAVSECCTMSCLKKLVHKPIVSETLD
jgi:hypothetical protein